MVLGGEEGLQHEICVDGGRLDKVSQFNYLGYVLNESCKDDLECCRSK